MTDNSLKEVVLRPSVSEHQHVPKRGRQERIWAVHEPLDFPGTVHGVLRGTPPDELMARQSAWFSAHADDRVLDWEGPR